MVDVTRRGFLATGGVLALSALSGGRAMVSASPVGVQSSAVRFSGDGISLNPEEYSRFLVQMAESDGFERDVYANGGVISRLEQKFARLLGKETAVFLPTGTMANHIALRRLTGPRKRVIVQSEAHIYNDSGDCAQKLSGLNLMPIEGDFNIESIAEALGRTASGRVKAEIGAISLESPLRRGFNTTHSLDYVAEIAQFARRESLGLHLDGARLFMQAAHYGFSPAEFAASFDTVYVSLYKNFNAAGGAILAGTKEMLADLLHERRMFGGSPCHVWPMAAVAMLFVDDFVENYRLAKAVTDQLMDNLKTDSRFSFELIPDGCNGVWLHLKGVDSGKFIKYLAEKDIFLMNQRSQWTGHLLMINPTISRMTSDQLSDTFRAAAGA